MEEIKKKIKDNIEKLYQEGANLLFDELVKKGQKVTESKDDKKRKKTNFYMD